MVAPQLHAFDYFGGTIMVGFRNSIDANRMMHFIRANSPRMEHLQAHRKQQEDKKNQKGGGGFIDWVVRTFSPAKPTAVAVQQSPKQQVTFTYQQQQEKRSCSRASSVQKTPTKEGANPRKNCVPERPRIPLPQHPHRANSQMKLFEPVTHTATPIPSKKPIPPVEQATLPKPDSDSSSEIIELKQQIPQVPARVFKPSTEKCDPAAANQILSQLNQTDTIIQQLDNPESDKQDQPDKEPANALPKPDTMPIERRNLLSEIVNCVPNLKLKKPEKVVPVAQPKNAGDLVYETLQRMNKSRLARGKLFNVAAMDEDSDSDPDVVYIR